MASSNLLKRLYKIIVQDQKSNSGDTILNFRNLRFPLKCKSVESFKMTIYLFHLEINKSLYFVNNKQAVQECNQQNFFSSLCRVFRKVLKALPETIRCLMHL
ncbi:hypothetical protein KsCSTR_30160 [Candidatus Kuenenia stuttgartiensis]|uniref:Uncharacterized protein n=1 Tax=Kuenenia stuttgartiensis TaxID=174633 RepID=Q1Q5J2_KUEST|nr:hypothetical protein KsCSTR_30160 [Candidatus Kuenenia stuttgartiensis]CAJ75285.1 unknown protein [Candidatus Kuenenia stuttgartiensis]